LQNKNCSEEARDGVQADAAAEGGDGAGGLMEWWDTLCQLEQDLGSCIFTVVYFCVYFVLHGVTLRLLIIGLIVLVQFSFQVSKP